MTGRGSRPSGGVGTEATTVELEEERDFLLRSLDDLDAEHDAGDLEDDDYRELKADYTARAAAVIRRLEGIQAPASDDPGEVAHDGGDGDDRDEGDDGDEAKAGRTGDGRRTVPPRRRPARTARARRPRWPLVLSLVATLALAGGSGYLVTRTSGERLPGQESSGGPERTPRALLQQAIDLDAAGQLVEAAKLYDAVLAEDPENVVALSRRGWVLGRSGRQAGNVELLQAGLGYLERANKVDPTYPDAHAFRGLVLGALARPGEAGCAFRTWLSVAPITDPQRPAIEGVLDEAIKKAGGTLPECPKAPVPVPVEEGRSAPAPPGGAAAHDPPAGP